MSHEIGRPAAVLSRRALLRAVLSTPALVVAGRLCAAATTTGARSQPELTSVVLLTTGLLQPCNAEHLGAFLAKLAETPVPSDSKSREYAEESPRFEVPTRNRLESLLDELAATRRDGASPVLIPVHPGPPTLYSLTASGNRILDEMGLRRLRDTVRLYLLQAPHSGTVKSSRGKAFRELSSDPLFQSVWSPISELGFATGQPVAKVAPPADRWRAVSAVFSTGLLVLPRDVRLSLFSFDTAEDVQRAGATTRGDGSLNAEGLALCLGISLKRMRWLAARRRGMYRTFTIPKSRGGQRTIEAPRIPLKTVQRFVLDFIFSGAQVDEHVHSFSKGRSTLTNAKPHTKKSFVANIDIEDFFGSIDYGLAASVFETLEDPARKQRWLTEDAVRLLSHLTTTLVDGRNGRSSRDARKVEGDSPDRRAPSSPDIKNGRRPSARLPQGAPTSPMISNLVLRDFDRQIAAYCEAVGVVYTRYADDITFSGEDREAVVSMIYEARRLLYRTLQFRVNGRKVRIMSNRGRQVVTGIVVNEKPQPPASVRKRIRAKFNDAASNPEYLESHRAELRGHLAYLEIFKDSMDPKVLTNYRTILDRTK